MVTTRSLPFCAGFCLTWAPLSTVPSNSYCLTICIWILAGASWGQWICLWGRGSRPCLERGHPSWHPAFCQEPTGSGLCLSSGEPVPSSKAALRSGWGDCLGATPTAQAPSDHPDPPGCSDRQPNPPKAAIEPSGSHRSTLVQALSLQPQSSGPSSDLTKKARHALSLPIDVFTWRWEWWVFVKNRDPCPSCTHSSVPAQQILHASDRS